MNGWLSNWEFACAAVCFLATLTVMGPAINWLRGLNFGQNVRDDVPETHQAKQGTPTMGGLIFIPIGLAFGLLAEKSFSIYVMKPFYVVSLFTLAGLGIGFLDDYLSIRRGKNLGLKARQKFSLQFLASGLFVYFAGLVQIPGWQYRDGSWILELRYFTTFAAYTCIAVWVMNCANLSDGLDGLVGSQFIVAIAAIMICAGSNNAASSFFSVTVGASALAYLCFNCPPAKIFMGDTGSLAMGAFVASLALTQVSVFALFLATAVWWAEGMSVVIQVVYFKLTKGKRIFKMSPLHHHFELSGWPETTVTARFIAASAFFGILVPIALWGVVPEILK